jgi:glycosyltransferase involved in cell wall biosynthesis
MFSIIIPTYNNLKYLKICLDSIKKNSSYNHEIILHINEGTDGTLEYVKKQNINFTFSKINDGICIGCNNASKMSKNDYILYAHDDMYFCPEWDVVMIDEVNKIRHENFYLSGIMINGGHIKYSCGNSADDFDENKLLNDFKRLSHFDFQGSTWAPHLIHKDLWNKVGGFSEEFSPGTGSDPDLNMKLWNEGVRIFKGLSRSKVYHFGSVVTRQKEKKFDTLTETGSKGNRIFLLKWGISIKFFKKYYLRANDIYLEPLKEPNNNMIYYIDLLKCKLSFLYYFIYKFFK